MSLSGAGQIVPPHRCVGGSGMAQLGNQPSGTGHPGDSTYVWTAAEATARGGLWLRRDLEAKAPSTLATFLGFCVVSPTNVFTGQMQRLSTCVRAAARRFSMRRRAFHPARARAPRRFGRRVYSASP